MEPQHNLEPMQNTMLGSIMHCCFLFVSCVPRPKVRASGAVNHMCEIIWIGMICHAWKLQHMSRPNQNSTLGCIQHCCLGSVSFTLAQGTALRMTRDLLRAFL